MAVRFAVIATLLAHADGWVTTSQSVYGAQISEIQSQMMCGRRTRSDPIAELGWLWHSPESSDDTRGLGGGITWAFDAKLCALILPQFREDIPGGNFVGCKEIHAAVARAFDKWAANSRFLKFVDMTEECTLAGLNYGPPTGPRHVGPACNPSSMTAGCVFPHGGCPLAEIWVTSHDHSLDGENGNNGGDGTAVATALPHAQYSSDFRYSNGRRPCFTNSAGVVNFNRQVVEAYAGTFSFNVKRVCWYLDSQFCAPFHKLKQSLGSPGNARLLIWGLTFGVTAIAILFYFCLVATVVMRTLHCGVCEDADERDAKGAHVDDEDGDGQLSIKERLTAIVRVIAHWNPVILTIFILMLILPPVITTRIFQPCFDCYDFEAAALHEIGHFLGLGHPDNIPDNWLTPANGASQSWALPSPGNNSYHRLISGALLNGTRPNPSLFCNNPWAAVEAGVPPGASKDIDETKLNVRYPTRDAQMESRTQHNPRTCLFDDDLEALAVLYPDCNAKSALFESVCHNINLNIGIVRIAVYLLFPTIICLFMVITCSSVVHGFERREAARHRAKYEQEKELIEAKHKKQMAKSRLYCAFGKFGSQLRAAGSTQSTTYPSVPAAVTAQSSSPSAQFMAIAEH